MDSGPAPRVMARQLARALTDAELNFVSGGAKPPKPPEGCILVGTGCDEFGGCYDLDCK
jgi:hypothetical protein